MPKTIDYPRTSYLSAWEVAEVVDDTGGKCAIETAARKLNRKVSGSFKAIIGSAVKFGLLTSKREFLTTTNLFRRIKHAYDKQEEKIYHREAFLHPPLFTQICRKFRNRELPVHMFDVMLIREFGVEEINAQSVAKAFVDGARMADIIDERNVIADIDQLAAQIPRRELASTDMPLNMFQPGAAASAGASSAPIASAGVAPMPLPTRPNESISSTTPLVPGGRAADAVSSLFGLDTDDLEEAEPTHASTGLPSKAGPEAVFVPSHSSPSEPAPLVPPLPTKETPAVAAVAPPVAASPVYNSAPAATATTASYSIQINGPGIDTQLLVQDLDDLAIVNILLEKIKRQLSR
ncbi:hypothetical protein GCM10027346_02320 [Hymenobacter seoulensis]